MPKKIYLSSGIPLIIHKLNNFHSFVLGIWIKHGSRHEPQHKNGLSHFIEHLFFQGTKKRTAKEISLEVDSIGGDLNAFTAREFTALYIKSLKNNLNKSIELITDIFSNPLFPEKEIEKERAIIMDEIRMINDNPEELVHDIFMEKSFDNSLGLPILGKENTVKNITREDIIQCFRDYYGANNCLISCAGNFEIDKLIEELEQKLTKRKSLQPSNKEKKIKFSSGIHVFQRDLSEVHLCLGFQAVPFKHRDRQAITLLNCIVGGSVSSRLFQEIREKRGLAYNIYSFISFYSDAGIFGIYTACEASKINKIIKIITSTLKKLNNIKEDELKRAKTQMISQILYSSESPSSIMQNLAYQDIYLEGIYKIREQISQINAITMNDIQRVKDYIFNEEFSLTLLGSIDRKKIDI